MYICFIRGQKLSSNLSSPFLRNRVRNEEKGDTGYKNKEKVDAYRPFLSLVLLRIKGFFLSVSFPSFPTENYVHRLRSYIMATCRERGVRGILRRLRTFN
ncbi:hypothetical protein AAMO2058_000018100 [Amorphochlora amoebiformis]